MISEANSVHQALPRWEHADHHRVPYWLFQRPDVYLSEQLRLFRGPHWHYLGLEVEVANPGDYVTTRIGNTPVILVRDVDGELYGFENRCAHRGALLALESRGHVRQFTCVYHAWSYNLQGDLTDVAFKEGINGSGGMARGFCMSEHGTTKLRVASIAGIVFGSFDQNVPGLEEYLGEEILARIERVLAGRTPVILGRYTQMLPNNWKLYMENVKDSYHASILHLFFTTFEINRLSQKGAIIVSEGGGHHVSWSAIDRSADTDVYTNRSMRSQSDYRLADPSMLQGFQEFGDDVTLQILTVFPGFVLQQIQNCIAIRQLVPQDPLRSELNWTYLGFDDDTPAQRESRLKQANLVGPAGYVSMEDGCVGGFVQRGVAGSPTAESVLEMGGTSTDSSESRITEASVRGFWKAYRAAMEL